MTSAPTEHAVHLHAGWTVWRRVMVRGAGFPARAVLPLADVAAAVAADEALALDAELEAPSQRLRAAIAERLPPSRLRTKVLRALERGEVPAASDDLAAIAGELAQLAALATRRADAIARSDAAVADALATTTRALLEVAASAPFREALMWQNRAALQTGVDWLRAHPGDTSGPARKKQQLIATYLQRYATKNDTIGFFGPVAWGRIVPEAGALEVRPGPTLLRERHVSLEHWAVDAIGSALMRSLPLRPLLAPRLSPSCALDGDALRFGVDRVTKVPPAIARTLARCDGATPARAIATELAADPALGLDGPGDILELLEDLAARKVVIWDLDLGALVRPEAELRALLEGLDDAELRARALAPLDRVEAARARVADAAGDVAALERALLDLEATFVEVTGQAATRRAGETYAGRTPVHEDCRRDLEVRVGGPLLARLGPVLALVGQSARWFTHELATRVRAGMDLAYRRLAPDGGPVGYARFLGELGDVFPAQGGSPAAAAVQAELSRRWAEVLELDGQAPATGATLARSSAELAAAVARAFAAPAPGWPSARHVAPDVMIAARGVDAICAGGGVLVLGEVHLANSLLSRLSRVFGPDDAPDALIDALAADLPPGRVQPVINRASVTRAQALHWSPHDLDLEISSTRSWRPRAQVLRAVDLVVEATGAGLVVRDVRSGRAFDVIAFFERDLQRLTSNHFKPWPRGARTPRIAIDGVITSRATWRLAPAELASFTSLERGPAQFRAARAWARALALPRWVFVKVPQEPKPMYIDLASPLFVEILARLARGAAEVTITEMLPTIEDTWLPDAQGETYTSELRLVMVDPVPWRAPAEETP